MSSISEGWFETLETIRLEISEQELMADLDPGWLAGVKSEERDGSAAPWVPADGRFVPR
jgi:hypothetical protein